MPSYCDPLYMLLPCHVSMFRIEKEKTFKAAPLPYICTPATNNTSTHTNHPHRPFIKHCLAAVKIWTYHTFFEHGWLEEDNGDKKIKVRYVDGHGEERLLYCVSMRVDGTFQLSKSNLTSIKAPLPLSFQNVWWYAHTHRRLPMYIMWCLCAYVTICWHQHVILGSTLRCIVSYDRLWTMNRYPGRHARCLHTC